MDIRVEEIGGQEESRWDEFVLGCGSSLPYHLLGWRGVFAQSYGLRPRYLVAHSQSKVVGVMPLFEVASLIQGHHFTTPPGGLCASSEEAGLALVERAKQLTRQARAQFLAIRDSRQPWQAGLVSDSSRCTVVLDLAEGSEVIRKRFGKDLRYHLRKAEASGLELRTGPEQLGDFHAMFSGFLRGYGTPAFGADLLQRAANAHVDSLWVLGAWHEGQMVGGAVQMLLSDSLHGLWGASLREHLSLRPNHLIYWKCIEFACERGLRQMDFGRSGSGSSQLDFKLAWGGTAVPLYQQYYLHRASRPPLSATDAEVGPHRFLATTWQHLPLALTRVLGPVVRRHVPFG